MKLKHGIPLLLPVDQHPYNHIKNHIMLRLEETTESAVTSKQYSILHAGNFLGCQLACLHHSLKVFKGHLSIWFWEEDH